MLGPGAVLRNSLCSLRSRRSDNRSKSDHEAWACCAAHARPRPCASRHGQRGVQPQHGPSLRSAPNSTVLEAERSDGPYGGSTPLWPCREAQGLRRAGAAQHAHASWSDLLRLFERRERSERSEFRSTAPGTSIAGCPKRSEGTRAVGSPFFCLLFFGDAKKRRCAAGRISRPAAACRATGTSNHREPIQRRSPSPQPSPQRGEGEKPQTLTPPPDDQCRGGTACHRNGCHAPRHRPAPAPA